MIIFKQLIAKFFTILFLLSLSYNAFASSFLGEHFHYKLFYKGIYSLNRPFFVADINVATKPQWVILPNGEKALDSQLTLSTQNSPFAKLIYPLFFRIRTLYQLKKRRLILLEKYKKVRSKIRHALFYADGKGTIFRYRADKLNPKKPTLPQVMQDWLGTSTEFRLYSQNKQKIPKNALDQLALINVVRTLKLAKGACQFIPLTSGKIPMDYHVCSMGKTQLILSKKKWQTTRFKLTATEIEKGKRIPSHSTLFIWLSTHQNKIPLRFATQDSTGLYQIDLQNN